MSDFMLLAILYKNTAYSFIHRNIRWGTIKPKYYGINAL